MAQFVQQRPCGVAPAGALTGDVPIGWVLEHSVRGCRCVWDQLKDVPVLYDSSVLVEAEDVAPSVLTRRRFDLLNVDVVIKEGNAPSSLARSVCRGCLAARLFDDARVVFCCGRMMGEKVSAPYEESDQGDRRHVEAPNLHHGCAMRPRRPQERCEFLQKVGKATNGIIPQLISVPSFRFLPPHEHEPPNAISLSHAGDGDRDSAS